MAPTRPPANSNPLLKVKELSETLAGMKGNLKRLEVMTRAWAAQPLFERGAKTSTAENFQQMQSVIITQRRATHIAFEGPV